MISDITQLLAQLASGNLVEYRHPNVELKQSWSQEVGKKISSNANKINIPVAWVVIGVDDKGKVLPNTAEWAKRTEEDISNHLNQYLDPLQACQSLEPHQLPNGYVIVLRLATPGAVVYWNKAAYKSPGTTLALMAPDEVLALTVKLPGVHDFTAQKCSTSLNPNAVKAFSSRVVKRSTDPTHGSLDKLEAEVCLSRLGINSTTTARLLFGNATYRVVFCDASGAPIRNDVRGPLYTLLESSLYEEIEIAAHRMHPGANRVFPPLAFQEAIANAISHAAYFETDGEIMLELFPDKLCISNLCTRESAYFANRWFSRSHKTVNALLMETLRLAGHVDQLGRGKHLIFSEYIANGRPAPAVTIERAGRYSRWRLVLPAAPSDERHTRLLQALRELYGDEHKTLVAFALVLWRNKPVKDLLSYVDGESSSLFTEVLSEMRGATFYWKEQDRIVLNRWARILLQEGVDSKAFSDPEELHLYNAAYTLHTKYHDAFITPKDVRDLGELGDTDGAHSLSSKLLTKWTKEGRVQRVRRGTYRFVDRANTPDPLAQAKELFSTPREDANHVLPPVSSFASSSQPQNLEPT